MPPGRPRQYADNAAKQRAYRHKRRGQDATYAQLALLQEQAAHEHVVGFVGGRLPQVVSHATAEQLQLQAEYKERDMLDALWLLQTLIADFGYDEVDTHVLQHLKPERRTA